MGCQLEEISMRSRLPWARGVGAASLVIVLLAVGAPATRSAAQGSAQTDPNQIVPLAAYRDMKWRMVGASRGGRVTGMAGVRQQPHTFYAGATGGGSTGAGSRSAEARFHQPCRRTPGPHQA